MIFSLLISFIFQAQIVYAKTSFLKDTLFDVSVHITELGLENSESMLLVHGLGDNAARDWKDVGPLLAKKYHVIMPDLPGFGRTGPSDESQYTPANYSKLLLSIAKKYSKSKKLIVIGHSLGGAISLSFTHDNSDLVEKLVLIDVAGVLQRSVFVKHLSRISTDKTQELGLVDRILRRINILSESVIEFVDQFDELNDVIMKNPIILGQLARDKVAIRAAASLIEVDYTDALTSIKVPTLILWGADDPISPTRTARILNSYLASSALEIFDGVGHVPITQAPTLVANKILTWLPAPYYHPINKVSPGTSDFTCSNDKNRVIEGSFNKIALTNCKNVRMQNVGAHQIIAKNSDLTMINVFVDSENTALDINSSTLVATGAEVRGKLGMKLEGAKLDFAAVRMIVQDDLVSPKGENFAYWSVSQIESPKTGKKNLHQRSAY